MKILLNDGTLVRDAVPIHLEPLSEEPRTWVTRTRYGGAMVFADTEVAFSFEDDEEVCLVDVLEALGSGLVLDRLMGVLGANAVMRLLDIPEM